MSAPAAPATTTPTDEVDLAIVDQIVAEKGRGRDAAIPILQAIQAHFRYLPRQALQRVCERTDISPAQLAGVSTFYSQFRLTPVGQHIISVCHGTACHVAGAEAISEAVRGYLAIEDGADTDPNGLFTVEKVACIGCCALAPVIRIDDTVYGFLTRENTPKAIEKFLRGKKAKARVEAPEAAVVETGAEPLVEIRLGLISCCIASGALAVNDALEQQLRRLAAPARVRCGGCVGMCHRVPIVDIFGPDGARTRYGNVTPGAMASIAREHLRPRGILPRARAFVDHTLDLLFNDSAWEPTAPLLITPRDKAAGAFFERQKLIVLEGEGLLDPLDLDEYDARGGYQALAQCVRANSPEDIIAAVRDAGLRGRGGAGFPTARKWELVRRQPGPKKYVVMNGDEGDPGAFMDRILLECYPHRVIEGIAIAALAVGADEGYLYTRAEYPFALGPIRDAIRQAEEHHYLGDRILGSDFSLRLHLMVGAGAFVCGEETGLMASIEGRRGMPRFRPPFPTESGLWGKPTSINNVETYATVPWIVRHGADAFARIGTAESKGTKIFALVGRINRGGLIEVPMGITIGEIVEEIGGGIRDGRAFKAIQIGGPSGGCLPASLRDVPIDFEELARYGAIMGSGGLVVMDDTTCMVDIARYFLQFTQDESCGKCTFCRIGTKRMLEILDRLCSGQGRHGDVELLEELGHRIQRTSLCGLGQTAPNPVLTTIRYFRDEYEAHIDGRCPAGKCRALITYRVTDECIGCTLCAQHCPTGAIAVRPYAQHEIDTTLCIRCGTCQSVCPADAIEVE